jgi:Type III restriction enzyme, res subunit
MMTSSPWPDQWIFLASVRKVTRAACERIVQEAERRGRVLGVRLPPQEDGDDEPWTRSPSGRRQTPEALAKLPQTLELVLGNQIYIAKDGLHPGLRNRLLRLAAFQNPEFYKAQAMRLSTWDTPRIIACAEDHPQHLGLPRGCLDELQHAMNNLGVRTIVRDERHMGRRLDVTFHGDLRAEQRAAANAMLRHDTGVLAATTAFGKTVVAAWLVAQRGVNTLVLVHRRQLLDQWIERLATFLEACRRRRSVGSAAAVLGRPGGSTWPSFRASSGTEWWTIASPTTAT